MGEKDRFWRLGGEEMESWRGAWAMRLRRETTLTIRQTAQRSHMGSCKSLNKKPYLAAKASTNGTKLKVMADPC